MDSHRTCSDVEKAVPCEHPGKKAGGTSQPAHRFKQTIRYFSSPLRVDTFLETQLLLLTFSTGIQDAITFPDFHGFASNQTGNTVLLAVGLAGHNTGLFDLKNVGLSLAAFIAGAVFSKFGNAGWLLSQILTSTFCDGSWPSWQFTWISTQRLAVRHKPHSIADGFWCRSDTIHTWSERERIMAAVRAWSSCRGVRITGRIRTSVQTTRDYYRYGDRSMGGSSHRH